jgi:hypothetical protein
MRSVHASPHPAPRSGEGEPRVNAVGGASASRLASPPRAPSTMLRMVPLPRCAGADKRKHSRGAIAPEFLRARRAKSLKPDPRRRAPAVGSRRPLDQVRPKNKTGRRDAGRRVVLPSASCGMRSRAEAQRAHLSASHHGTCGSERTPPLSFSRALPGTWLKSGRYPPPPVPVQRRVSQTGRNAGRAPCRSRPGA